MTPETYLQFYRSRNSALADAIRAGEAPSCPLTAERTDPPGGSPQACRACRSSLADVLHLLYDPQLSEIVDLNTFFFLTDSVAVGGPLNAPLSSDAPADNIGGAEASFRRFSPCGSGLLEVAGSAYFAVVGDRITALETVDQISASSLRAAAFSLIGQGDPDEDAAAYRRAVRALRRGLSGEEADASAGADGCTAGLIAELSARTLSRVVTFTAGPLVLQNLSVIGSLGDTLVLGNSALRRIYLVCAKDVQILG